MLDPIDWDEVLTPPAELAAATRELIPAASSLSAAELEQVAIAIRDRPELWEPLLVVDAHRRRYRLLYEDERTDIWVLCWMPGQSTGFHDHDVSDVGIAIARGAIVERQLRLPTGATALELRPGRHAPGAGRLHPLRRARRGHPRGLDPLLLPSAHEGRPVPRRSGGRAAARRRARPPRAGRRDDRARGPRARLSSSQVTRLEDARARARGDRRRHGRDLVRDARPPPRRPRRADRARGARRHLNQRRVHPDEGPGQGCGDRAPRPPRTRVRRARHGRDRRRGGDGARPARDRDGPAFYERLLAKRTTSCACAGRRASAAARSPATVGESRARRRPGVLAVGRAPPWSPPSRPRGRAVRHLRRADPARATCRPRWSIVRRRADRRASSRRRSTASASRSRWSAGECAAGRGEEPESARDALRVLAARGRGVVTESRDRLARESPGGAECPGTAAPRGRGTARGHRPRAARRRDSIRPRAASPCSRRRAVDEHLATTAPGVLGARRRGRRRPPPLPVHARGDARGPAGGENALRGAHHEPHYTAMPRVTFTDPEVAAVGMTEAEARARGSRRTRARKLDARARQGRALGESEGFVKVVIDRKTGKLVGGRSWPPTPATCCRR